MANGEYTRRQFTSYDGLNVCEEWRTYGDNSESLADVDHYNGALSSATVYDPADGWSRHYAMRPKANIMAIVERHLERCGYKKRVEFHRLDGVVETD